MRAATCFSGIGAPEIAMPGWDWVWHAEIEPFPSAVMAHHHPGSVNLGDVLGADFLDRAKAMGPIDVMAGGPPCQGFSVAGLRGGMSDPRGNLTLRWVQILHAIQPRNAVTENVPGWLSMPDNAFGCFLGGLVGADDALCSPLDGGKWPSVGMVAGPRARAAWRILDAQYFGVAQRRRRVFVVADFGNGADPAEVLFERAGMSGNPAPRRQTREETAGTLAARTSGGCGLGTDFDLDGGLICADIAPTLNAQFGDTKGLDDQHINGGGGLFVTEVALCLNAGAMGRRDAETETLIPTKRCDFDVAHSLRAEGFDASENGTGRGTPLVPELVGAICKESFSGGMGGRPEGAAAGHVIAFPERLSGTQYASAEEISPSLGALNPTAVAIQAGALRENPSSGPDGVGVQEGIAYTLEARAEVQAVAFNITPSNSNKDYNARQSERAQAITAGSGVPSARGGDVVAEPIVLMERGRDGGSNLEYRQDGTANAILTPNGGRGGFGVGAIQDAWAVRRLTPVECARLQGFPDEYLDITYRGKLAADGNKYKALGNSWAVPVGAWILNRAARAILTQTGESK